MLADKENEILKLKEKSDRKKCKKLIDVINKIAKGEKTPIFTLGCDGTTYEVHKYDRKTLYYSNKGELWEVNEYGKDSITNISITKEMLNKEIIILDGSDKE